MLQGPLNAFVSGAPHGGGPSPDAVRAFGVTLIGATPHNLHKLVLTVGFIAIAWIFAWILRQFLKLFIGTRSGTRFQFWAKQGVSLVVAGIVILGIMSIWFDDPTRLTTAVGLVTAGLAFALQKVVTSLAGYFVILRGNTFTVGDRISMGGVRGDVVALGFTQTTIMEMGQPPAVQSAEPAMWVKSRQFTGRIVTVSNSTVFDTPVFNYTREFPFIYEEMTIWIAYRDDHAKAEQVLLDAARKHQVDINELSAEASHRLSNKYGVMKADFEPRVYYRLTDNWVDLTVRFIARDHGVRDVKDAMSREVLARLTEAGIGMASSTIELTGLPPLQIQRTVPNA